MIADCTQDSEHAESQVEIPSRSTEGQLEKTPPADMNSSPHDETDTNKDTVLNQENNSQPSLPEEVPVTPIYVGWLVGVQRPASNFSAIFRTRTFKNLNAMGLETRKGDGYGRIILPVQQVSHGPLIMSIMLIMSCNTGFFNVRRWWQSLNTGPRFYLRLIRRTGWL